jgi:hypothetical protein
MSHYIASGKVSPLGARRRLRALAALGHDNAAVAEWCGKDIAYTTRLIQGQIGGIDPELHDRIAEKFDQPGPLVLPGQLLPLPWSMTPGPCAATRAAAFTAQWATAVAWEDIDIDDSSTRPDRGPRYPKHDTDPKDAQLIASGQSPAGGHLKKHRRNNRDEAIRLLTVDHKFTADQIAARLQCTARTVQRARARLGILQRTQPAEEALAS